MLALTARELVRSASRNRDGMTECDRLHRSMLGQADQLKGVRSIMWVRSAAHLTGQAGSQGSDKAHQALKGSPQEQQHCG